MHRLYIHWRHLNQPAVIYPDITIQHEYTYKDIMNKKNFPKYYYSDLQPC
jgi:hypothetical protein